jgi:hypothetical protein
MARTTRDPRARATLKHMAEVWFRLANRLLTDAEEDQKVSVTF